MVMFGDELAFEYWDNMVKVDSASCCLEVMYDRFDARTWCRYHRLFSVRGLLDRSTADD